MGGRIPVPLPAATFGTADGARRQYRGRPDDGTERAVVTWSAGVLPAYQPESLPLLCRVTLATVVLNVVTGAAVRLSDSGLGCPDWPTCSQHHLTPPLRFHPLIEFGNRAVVALLVVAAGADRGRRLLRRPGRRDLRWLSLGLILGMLGEAVVGAIVVYSKLNAYVVVGHFLVGMALLATATILTLRAGHAAGRGVPAASPGVLRATRVLLVVLGAPSRPAR